MDTRLYEERIRGAVERKLEECKANRIKHKVADCYECLIVRHEDSNRMKLIRNEGLELGEINGLIKSGESFSRASKEKAERFAEKAEKRLNNNEECLIVKVRYVLFKWDKKSKKWNEIDKVPPVVLNAYLY